MNKPPRPILGYQILRKIGHGSYADVYECKKNQTGKIFAVKIFKDLEENKPAIIKKEIDIVKKLNHPNIIKCIDSFEDQNDKNRVYAVVFEYCGKGNLQQFMGMHTQQKKRVPERYAKKYILKILDSLIHLHENKIVHRDLKLANILINDNYEIKLADFGLSKQYQQFAMLKTLCGTPLTMAPEILKKKQYTQKCDTWSFGVICYYLLYAEYPFNNARDPIELLKVIQSQKIPKFPLSNKQNQNQVSESAKDFIKLCLTLSSESRPSIEKLIDHDWLKNKQQSVNEQNYMKHFLDEQSEIVKKINIAVTHSMISEIQSLIKITHLVQDHIEAITKGFEEFYPNQKRKMLLFYIFIGGKIQTISKNKIKLYIENTIHKISTQKLQKLTKHINHIQNLNQQKVKSLDKSLNGLKFDCLEKAYEEIIRFVSDQGHKLIETDSNNLKKMTFLSNLINFFNSQVKNSIVKINLNTQLNDISEADFQQFTIYTNVALDEGRICQMVNTKADKLSNGLLQIQKVFKIEIQNKLDVENSTQTWKIVGNSLASALEARISCQEQIY